MFDKDKINMADPSRIGPAAMAILTSIQVNYTPEEQGLAIGLALSAIVNKYNAYGGDVLTAVDHILNHHGDHPEIRAVVAYTEGEL